MKRRKKDEGRRMEGKGITTTTKKEEYEDNNTQGKKIEVEV